MVARDRTATIVVVVDGDEEVARWCLRVHRPDLSTVDDLARLALWARRRGWTVQLHQCCPALVELLALAGLTDLLADRGRLPGQVGRQPEEDEQLGPHEVVVPRDPPL